MMNWLAVGVGGFIGALARYGLSSVIARYWGVGFPWGTLTVNGLGCLVIGALLCLTETTSAVSHTWQLFLVVGILGALTTFSTFGVETFQFLRSGALGSAALYVFGSLVVGLLFVYFGFSLVKGLLSLRG